MRKGKEKGRNGDFFFFPFDFFLGGGQTSKQGPRSIPALHFGGKKCYCVVILLY